MERLREKIEKISLRIDGLRVQTTLKASTHEITAAQYQMYVTYLGRLEERKAQLLMRLGAGAAANSQKAAATDALIELYGADTPQPDSLSDAFKQRMALAQKLCQTLNGLLRSLTGRPRLWPLGPWPFFVRLRVRRLTHGVDRAKSKWLREAQRFGAISRDTLRACPLPSATRDLLRTMVKLLREIDSRALNHFIASVKATHAKPQAMEGEP